MSNFKTCISFFFILYTEHTTGMFFYAFKPVKHIQERSESYVREKRPELLNQISQSFVCSEIKEERQKRCEEAVKIDYCRQNGITLLPNSSTVGEPKIYEIKEFEFISYVDIVIACSCPTQPNLILLTDARGYSKGQVNVMIFNPEPLIRVKDQLGVYTGKFTGVVRSAFPIINTNKLDDDDDTKNKNGGKTVSGAGGLEQDGGGSSKDISSSVNEPDAALRARSPTESSGLVPVQLFGDSGSASFDYSNDSEGDENYNGNNSEGLSPDKNEGESELFENPFYNVQPSEKNIQKFTTLGAGDSSKKQDNTSASTGKAKSPDKNESSESSGERSRFRRMRHAMKNKMKRAMNLGP